MRKSIIFSILAVLCGCKAERPVAPHVGPFNVGSGVKILTSKDTIAGMMETMSVVVDNPEHGLSGSGTGFFTSAIFFDSSWKMVQAANVELNGITIRPQNSTHSFGVTQHWQITANSSGTVPHIDDSVQAPNLFHITYPSSICDTISPAAGFTCTYENPGTDSVTIIIYYDSLGTHVFYDTSIHHHKVPSVYLTVANTGSYFVPSSLLSSLPNSGVTQVWVVAYRAKVITASGRHHLIYAISRARSWCAIKNEP